MSDNIELFECCIFMIACEDCCHSCGTYCNDDDTKYEKLTSQPIVALRLSARRAPIVVSTMTRSVKNEKPAVVVASNQATTL